MTYNPALQGMVDEARAVSCIEWLERDGHAAKLIRSGHNYAGPCPSCGGTDRFGVDAAANKWLCRQHGIGGNDAISMVMLLWPLKSEGGEKFIEACELITGRKRTEVMSEEETRRRADELARKKAAQDAESEKRRLEARASAWKLWQRGNGAGVHVGTYFGIRNIPVDLAAFRVLRELDQLEYWHDYQVVHKGPAMLALIHLSTDKFAGVHRTWLDPNGRKGKAVVIKPGPDPEALDVKKVLGSLGDGAIRLVTPRDAAGVITANRMVAGEGIETTLTPFVHSFEERTAYWCGISLGHMAGRALKDPATGKRIDDEPDMDDDRAMWIPPWVDELVLLGDNDAKTAKQMAATKAAMTRAAKRAKRLKPGRTVKVAWAGGGSDWNDMAMSINGKGTEK